MKSYFADREMTVKVADKKSPRLNISNGVPQGSILGPLLFIIFINDIAIGSELWTILFADDTTLWETGADLDKVIAKFTTGFLHLLEWINHNKLFINWSKTKLMVIFMGKQSMLVFPSYLEFGSNRVDMVDEFKLSCSDVRSTTA